MHVQVWRNWIDRDWGLGNTRSHRTPLSDHVHLLSAVPTVHAAVKEGLNTQGDPLTVKYNEEAI